MKFAKELEQDLVPEWRVKYMDYKAGKKHVKAVARAMNRVNATPRPRPTDQTPRMTSLYGATSPATARTRRPSTLRRIERQFAEPSESLHITPAALGADTRSGSEESTADPFAALRKTSPAPIPKAKSPSSSASSANKHNLHYGSFVPTPATKPRPNPFELPEPAISPDTPAGNRTPENEPENEPENPLQPTQSASMSAAQGAYQVGPITPPPRSSTFASLRNRMPQTYSVRASMRRMMSMNGDGSPATRIESHRSDVDMAVLDQVRSKQKGFFKFMDRELDKVETFYKSKEDEAGQRLSALREQLHEMRNRRIEEVMLAQQAKATRKEDERTLFNFSSSRSNVQSTDGDGSRPTSQDPLKAWLNPLDRFIGEAKAKAFGPHPGSNSKALQNMMDSPELRAKNQEEPSQILDQDRDYIRRPHYSDEVPYRTAKRKLKLALQEFYRGMELLKSYALLNRTAFRKINKKYDKAVNAHPPLRYMSEKVNKAWFVNSDVLDGYIHAVEDLYARYFERGNHKIATGKLRSSSGRPQDQSRSAFQNGLLIGIGAVFSIQGIIYGRDLLRHSDPTIVMQTSYLLQIYGGYFLALYLFCWFCLDCRVWARHKINYAFVFEFDPRHNLDWRELAEFPSFLILLLGLFVWVNFSRYGAPEMYIYYPVILIFVTILIIFFPGPYMFHRSRKWFVYSHWRLLLAGLYPVEFRDFFLGDMYCSLTYFMSNIELFFCLYAHYWDNPSQCNSSHSRLLGFFSTLPGIWRALQCLRRYYDTRNVFPHLVNCGKYSMTIMYYVTLSMYRMNHSKSHLAVFSTFAAINACYCSIWDLLMDWSLLQPNASKSLLRDVRGFKSAWWYYGAMILDPILRFNWIFYAIYTHSLQHSTMVSFLVALSEVTRRGVWTLFRVENEHCANVARFKASRDVPLPYSIPTESEEDLQRQETHTAEGQAAQISTSLERHRSYASGVLEAQDQDGDLRHRAPSRTFTSVIADAHTQDFEKKRKPGAGDGENTGNRLRRDATGDARGGSSDDEDDDEDDEDASDEQDMFAAQELLRQGRATRLDEGRDR
ncbi:Protein SYG1-like protein [Lachnellula occidentalis]|uniref:Protein SYG1-like protein n=1 Tax=Lachnellula occidentalis TaxID=215460 RepID=A0A8H8S887_9HELO|nr:Protein SYG1-like protein [Lachnellula occidentalis]